MREFKFRVYNLHLNCYHKLYIIDNDGLLYDYNSYEPEILDKKYYKIEQFTGLHDKEGKEIYEGDIVERSGSRLIVKFIAPYFGAVTKKDYDHFLYPEDKVIGNINENPELLK